MRAPRADRQLILRYLWKYRAYVGFGLASLFVVDGLEILPPLYLKGAVDTVTQHLASSRLAWLATAYLATAVLQGLGRYGWRMYLIRASLFAGRDLRQQYADHLFGLSASFFDRKPIGDLMSLATSDVEAVRTAIGTGVLVFADSFFYFLTVPIAMFILSPKLTLLAFAPLPLVPFLVARNETAIHERFEKVQECFGRISALVQEGLSGMRVVKAFAREDVQDRRLNEVGEQYARLNLSLSRVHSAFGPTLDLTMSIGMVLLLWVGGHAAIAGAVTLGTFVAFQRYVQKMVWPMASLGLAFSFYQRAVSSAGRLNAIFDERSDVADRPAPIGRWKTAGRVELRDLHFAFPGAPREVLRGITLTVEPGERVAFVGPIGSGKSALLGLIPRIYPVVDGHILIDGIDVNQWPLDELRRQVGYVGQNVFLFSETVSENLAFGLRELEASRIESAARLAAVHDEVLSLGSGYSTQLGEKGVNLSGGQKQRLTIARAIASEPPILVLDDALSAVDTRTEERILRGLRARHGRNTELIAAHRISTIRDADRIVVLEQGRIVQEGTHERLARENGLYRRYYEQQRLKEDLDRYAEELEGAT